MKRLLAMLLSLIIAITNNIGYQAQGDMQFAHGKYYRVAVGDEPDYRERYGNINVGGRRITCNPQPRYGKGSNIKYPDGNYHYGQWIVESIGIKFEDIPDVKEYQFTSKSRITMPFSGKLVTSSSTSDGHSMVVSMEVAGEVFKIQLENMERWWCCMSKASPDKTDELGNPIWVHTCKELKNTRIMQGQVLGMATENTTAVVMTKDGTPISWKEFYNR